MNRGQLLQLLSRWSNAGYKATPAGSVYLGRPKPEPGKGFFHQVFCPIVHSARDQFGIENGLMTKFPYWRQLEEVNGVNLFYRKLYLYGVHRGQVSSLDLPFNILNANIENWGTLSYENALVIGGYTPGESRATLVEMNDGSVTAFDRDLRQVCVWPSLDVFLYSAIAELSERYDDSAEEILERE